MHAYVALPGGRTGYLSELRSGAEVLVADAAGRARAALVGRAKVERRPLVIIEVRAVGGGAGRAGDASAHGAAAPRSHPSLVKSANLR